MAADLIARRPWSSADLGRRLQRRGAPAEVAAAVVADLVARGHLDDGAFARQWVAARAARGLDAVRLANELRARGVARDLIEAALVVLPSETELDRARAAAARRLPSLRAGSPAERMRRLQGYLARRGFRASVATAVARECTMTPP